MSLLDRMERIRQTSPAEGNGETGGGEPTTATVESPPAPPQPFPVVPAPPQSSGPRSQDLAAPEPSAVVPVSVSLPQATGDAASGTSHLYELKYQVFDQVVPNFPEATLKTGDEGLLRNKLDEVIDKAITATGALCTRQERSALAEEFKSELVGFGPLDTALNDPSVDKISVSSPTEIHVDRLGQPEKLAVRFRDEAHLMSIIQRIAETVGGRIDSKVPLLDRKLPDGTRIRAKIPPIATVPTISIDNKGHGNPFEALKLELEAQQESQHQPYLALKQRIQDQLIAELDPQEGVRDRERLRAQIQEMINAAIAVEDLAISRAERTELCADLENEILGLGPLEPLLNDPEVSEIMVISAHQIYVERRGKLTLSDRRFRDDAHALQIIDKIVSPLGRRIDEKSPYVDARLLDGSRVNAIIPPLALKGPCITIRKFSKDPFTISDLVQFGSLTNELAQFLRACVLGRLNVVVSGGTGSGKTTLLNVLSSFIPEDERIVTIEDAAEIQLRQDHVVSLESRPKNIEGAGEVTIRDLVKNSLRMRPDRIVVGECRGGEALDMLQAMNTGHDGSLTTGHANSPREMLSRLETMCLMAGLELPLKAIREQVAAAVDLIIQQTRLRDGTRKIVAVTEVVGMEGEVITMQDLFVFEQEGIDDAGKVVGRLKATGIRPKCYDRIQQSGIRLPMDLFKG